jgi:hypothetical protein
MWHGNSITNMAFFWYIYIVKNSVRGVPSISPSPLVCSLSRHVPVPVPPGAKRLERVTTSDSFSPEGLTF